MALHLDHLILAVNDVEQSLDFYTRVVGLATAGQRPPFTLLRITSSLVLQLAPWGTKGGEHLAFSLEAAEFDEALQRLRGLGVKYGDSFHDAENMRGPADSDGARGTCRSVYLLDPSRHLIELLCYG